MPEKDKRYYWLKLKRDFFKRHDIRIIESMPNGRDYILFYLKLLCESVDHEGKLRFSDAIPYNEDMLATITSTNVDIVRSAIKVFTQLNMMVISEDGTYFMCEVDKMIGSETYWAEKKRLQREKEGTSVDNVGTMSSKIGQFPTCPRKSKSIEKEIEKEIEIKDKVVDRKPLFEVSYQQIADMYNETCVSFPRLTALSEKRKKAIKARLKVYTLDDFQRAFEKAEASSFLKGRNDRDWSANFDWIIKDSNMAKILDGNYDDREKRPQNKGAQQLDDFYSMASSWASSEREGSG